MTITSRVIIAHINNMYSTRAYTRYEMTHSVLQDYEAVDVYFSDPVMFIALTVSPKVVECADRIGQSILEIPTGDPDLLRKIEAHIDNEYAVRKTEAWHVR